MVGRKIFQKGGTPDATGAPVEGLGALLETGEETGGLDAGLRGFRGVVRGELLFAEFKEAVRDERVLDRARDVELAFFLVEGDEEFDFHSGSTS